MNISRTFLVGLSIVTFASGASAPSPTASRRAEAAGLIRANDPAAAATLLEQRAGAGKTGAARDYVMAEEWMALATQFFNRGEQQWAEKALNEALAVGVRLHQQRGVAADLHRLYRNLGTLAETILRNRTVALAYYDLAIKSAEAGRAIPPAEISDLRRKMEKTTRDSTAAAGQLGAK